MRLFVITIVLVIIAPIFGQSDAEAVIKFDVKTPMDEKSDLALAKLAVIQVIGESDWARVVEFGEDYSLWLTNYEIMQDDDNITIELTVELRTAAAFTDGRLLDRESVEVSFRASSQGELDASIMYFVGNAVVDAAYSMTR